MTPAWINGGARPFAYRMTSLRPAIISLVSAPSTTSDPFSSIVDIVKSGDDCLRITCPSLMGEPPSLATRFTAVIPK